MQHKVHTCFAITLISVDPHRRYFPVLVDRDEDHTNVDDRVQSGSHLVIFSFVVNYDLSTGKNKS